jgi:hypothetical protein
MSSVNGAMPTTIIVAGLALAGYALLTTARNRRMGISLLAALGVLEILLLVEVGIIVARLADGERPAGLAVLIGYLIAMPLVPVAAAFWGLLERSRWGPAVIAVAGLVASRNSPRLRACPRSTPSRRKPARRSSAADAALPPNGCRTQCRRYVPLRHAHTCTGGFRITG